jgi:Tol biopolymer transport system component
MNIKRLSVLAIAPALAAVAAGQVQPVQPARYYNPRFAADSSRVIFESMREGKMTIYSISVDGTGLRKLTDGRQDDAQPQWSADGNLITFTSNGTPGALNKVFVMGGDGGNRRQVSTGSKHDAAPSFSTDGRMVAWAATTELAENWRDIGVAAADGTTPQRLITSGPGNDQSPVWVSSTRLVFVREFPPKTDWRAMSPEDHEKRRASSEIMAINADGTGLAPLTTNAAFDGEASWAGALERIFFSTTRNGASELFSMNADGTDPRRVADFAGVVSWDGKLVAYSKVVAGRSGIFVRDLAGGAERELIGG